MKAVCSRLHTSLDKHCKRAEEALERVEAAIARDYPARTGLQPTLYRVRPVDGATVSAV